MNHRQTVQAVARRLPHVGREIVAEVLEVTAEVWAMELSKPGTTLVVFNLGKLEVEVQQMKLGGAIREKLQRLHGTAPETIQRCYFRFRPTGWLKQHVEEQIP